MPTIFLSIQLIDNLLVTLGNVSLVVTCALPTTPTAPTRGPSTKATVAPCSTMSTPAACPVGWSALNLQYADTKVGETELEDTTSRCLDGCVCGLHDLSTNVVIAVSAGCCEDTQRSSGTCGHSLERDRNWYVCCSIVNGCLEHVRSSLVVVTSNIVSRSKVAARGGQSLCNQVIAEKLEHVPAG